MAKDIEGLDCDYSKNFARPEMLDEYVRKFQNNIDGLRHEYERDVLAKIAFGDLFDCSVGSGRFIGQLPLVTSYVGHDFSEPLLAHCKMRYPSLTFIHGDLLRGIERPDSSYDTVLLIRTLNNLPKRVFIVKECLRLLRPNGVFCVSLSLEVYHKDLSVLIASLVNDYVVEVHHTKGSAEVLKNLLVTLRASHAGPLYALEKTLSKWPRSFSFSAPGKRQRPIKFALLAAGRFLGMAASHTVRAVRWGVEQMITVLKRTPRQVMLALDMLPVYRPAQVIVCLRRKA